MNNSKFLRRALSAFLAAAMTLSMAGCGTKDEASNLHSNEARQIVNYFTNSDFVMPESVGNTENIFYANGKVFVSGSTSTEEGEKKTQIFDMATKEEKEVDLSALEAEYVNNAFLDGNTAYICYQTKDYSAKLSAFDIETGQVKGEADFGTDSFPIDMRLAADGSLEVVKMKWGMMNAQTHFVTYEPGTLTEKSSVDVSEKLKFDAQESAVSIIDGPNDSKFVLSVIYDYESGDANIKVYKTNVAFEEEFSVDEFSDMEGYPDAMIKLKNGNPCILSSADYSKFFFNEIDAETGDVVNRYECELGEYPTIINGFKAEDADIVYKTEEGIYKLSVASQKPEKIYSFGKDISEDFAGSNVISCSGNSMLLYNEIWGDSSQALFMFDAEGNELGSVPVPVEDGEYIDHMAVSNEGKIYCLVEKGESVDEGDGSFSYQSTYFINMLNEEGELENTISIDALTGKTETYAQGFTVADNGRIYISTSSYSRTDGSTAGELIIIDNEGNEICVISDDTISYIEDVIVCSEGEYIIYRDDSYNVATAKIDTENGAVGEKCEFDLPMDIRVVKGDDRYDFCYRTSEGVYGYSIKDKKSTEIINWIDSDIYSDISSVALAGNDSMFCLSYDYENGESSITLLKRADEDILKMIQNKTIITVAGMDISYNDSLQTRIVDFNKNSDQYRVQINDYNKYSSYEDDTYKSGAFMLNNDITSGNVPDIIIGNSEVDMTSYTAKGVLADLKPFIDSDEEIKMENYFENIFDVYSYDGKLCQLVTNFSLVTLAAKASEAGNESGWRYDDFFKFTDQGNVFYKQQKTELADLFIKRNLGEFVDFEKKTSNFDNANFINLLELINREGLNEDDEEIVNLKNGGYYGEQDYLRRWVDGHCKLEALTMYGFNSVLDLQQGAMQEEVAFKGFPSDEGNGALIAADATFAICSKSKNKEAAWDFLRAFMLEDYQENLNEKYSSTFPVMKTAFENLVNKSMSENEQGGGYFSVVTPDGQYEAMKPLDSATADKVRNLATTAGRAMISDERIGKIVDEQLTEFFAGSKSAAETASAIQNKVSLYLKEIK